MAEPDKAPRGHIVRSRFRPAWWLPGPHLHTLWPSLFRRRPLLDMRRRRIELHDGDFIDLALPNAEQDRPRVLIIHGLEGDLQSHYAASLMVRLLAAGWQPVFMHLRGSSGVFNRLDRAYHSGASDDLAEVLDILQADPQCPVVAAVGFSLGGNLLLKYLGECPQPQLSMAVAVSVPFVLRDAMLRLDQGFSVIYRRHLISRLKASYRRKFDGVERVSPLAVELDDIHDFNSFDERITSPLNGFAGVFDYYTRANARQYLPQIDTPTWIFECPRRSFHVSGHHPLRPGARPGVTLELSDGGGHVGFVHGRWPWRPRYWLDERITELLQPWLPGHV